MIRPALTPDQQTGARFLASRVVAYLADVPGLGKTAQYIRAIDLVGAEHAIVVCPPVLRLRLQAEFDLWSLWGHTVHVIETGADEIPATGVLAISYNLASQPHVLDRLCQRKRGPVIFDEAHALKGYEAQRTQACLGKLAHSVASHVWFVSGTPAPNNAAEMFPFLRTAGLWPGTFEAFVKRYCTTKPDKHDPRGWRVTGTKDPAGVRALMTPALIRRTEVTGRPPLSVDTVAVAGDDAYAQLAPDFLAEISAALALDDWSFADLEHMSTVRRLVGLSKVRGVLELARAELETGHNRLLIFGHHTDVLAAIAYGLAPYSTLINGSTDGRADNAAIDAFQSADPTPRVIVGNMQTLGEGVTLHAASRILIAEPSWTPKDNSQVIARAWRRGQLRPVHASFLALHGSIDDAITKTVARKTKQLIELLDS